MTDTGARRRLADVGALAVALLGVWMVLGPYSPVVPVEAPAWWWVDLVGGLVAAALLLARRRAPLAVTVAVSVLGLVVTTAWLAGPVAAFALALRRPWYVAAVVIAVSLAASPLQWTFRALTPAESSWGSLAYAAAISAAVIGTGAAVRARRQLLDSLVERAERAEREAALRAEAARTGERTRIAREMHDVLAHRLSLVSMHAAALAHRRGGGRSVEPAELDDALDVIRRGAQDALNDLRAILGVLRADVDEVDSSGRAPQPTLADLDRLVEGVRAAGADVALHDDLDGGAAAVPAESGRTLYRITQEALTNATRHAPGRPIEVRLRGRPGADAELDVVNPLPVPTSGGRPTAGAGAGLVGISERVELAGGRVLSCGPDGGSFRVAVRVPWRAGT
ncbi:sensor histidine kinase [Actinomycetospora termitidis]|uniref:histidine kinase n=1 Tax=Actinomycetospora termitidis TaxID=3053470 RepID=A0ABT7M6T7_9PSEU|nr:histidine kinase [Actinomycetospora sp. Odt1-22]MDL5156376.1 histidine kinase [Actinomycetospora sp. Odt1-22]